MSIAPPAAAPIPGPGRGTVVKTVRAYVLPFVPGTDGVTINVAASEVVVGVDVLDGQVVVFTVG